MEVIDSKTVVVFSFAELKSALEGDNGYLDIYMGADINMSGGIRINSKKSNVMISGTYNGVTYRLEDVKSLATGDTISVSNTMKYIVVRDVVVTGNNYYGVIFVTDSSSYKDVILEYNNVNYTGCQIGFHPYGLTKFIDCTINIIDTSLVSGNEVAECNRIELGGKTVINHNSKSNSSFWFRNSNPSFTVLENADVKFTSVYRELFYGPTNLAFTVMKGASIDISSYNGLGFGTYGTGTTVIDINASLSFRQNGANGSYPSWYSYGSITLNSGSSLSIISDYNNIGSSNYCILFPNTSGGIYFNNPHKVLLYNKGASVIGASSSIPFVFYFSRINLFVNVIDLTENISSSTLPNYAWYKLDNVTSYIKGTFSNSSTKVVEHNFSGESYLPDISSFIIGGKKIISVDVLPLVIGAITDEDTKIEGLTSPNGSILISYNGVNSVVSASDDGRFSYTLDEALPIGTNILFNVKEKDGAIFVTKEVTIVFSGELVLESATSLVEFSMVPISTNPVICPRNGDLVVRVMDSRVRGSSWKLYASIDSDLTSSSGDMLERALIFRDKDGNVSVLSETPMLIYTGSVSSGVTVTDVSFDDSLGILLCIRDSIKANVVYRTNIIWSIVE